MEKYKIHDIISPDDIRNEDYLVQQGSRVVEQQVWSIVKAKLGACLAWDKNCLIDATNIHKPNRQDLLVIANAFDAKKYAVVYNIDFDIAMIRNRRPPVFQNGLEISRTVPEHVMHRMRYYWDDGGLGHTKQSIKNALKNEFDDVMVINRYADERDCQEMGGFVDTETFDVPSCRVDITNDLVEMQKHYYME